MERRRQTRGLTMKSGRKIPRPPADKPSRPAPPEATDPEVSGEVAKAAGELVSLAASIRACDSCERACPERAFGTGAPMAPVMLVKDVPSAADLDSGNSFAGEADPLTKAFAALGIPLGWIYGSTAVRCGPAPATLDQVRACSTHLLVEIEAVRPRVIVVFGESALDGIRAIDGRCGFDVPADIARGEPTAIRSDVVVILTEPLPAGVNAKDAKKRLWQDLKAVPGLIG